MGVRISQALLDRATAYVGQPLAARRYEQGLAEISALYSEITGQPAATCRQCQYSTYLAVVQAYIRQATRELHPETMAESNYIIAPGFENEQFVHEGLSEAITAENLTDKAAEFLIGKGFGHAIKRKDGQEPSGKLEMGKADADPKASAGETKAKADLATEKAAHKTTKEALKAEKDTHAATKKELVVVSGKLGEVEKALAEAQATIEQLRKPAADTDSTPGAQA